MLFGHKENKLQVDLGDLENQQENLLKFLESHLKINVSVEKQNKLAVDPEKTDPEDLKRVVTKFIYHRNLNGAHWVSIDGNIVKINRFKGAKKPEKKDKKKNAPHQTLTQSWGL